MGETGVTIKGIVVSGIGQGKVLVKFDWVEKQIISKLGFVPFAGTLNLKISDPASLAAFSAVKTGPAIIIEPPNPEYCEGRIYRVLVDGRIEAAIVWPCVPNYPEDVAEIIAPVNLRDALKVADGDSVSLKLVDVK